MLIGVPKEIKNNENRVGLTPATVLAYIKAGHRVAIERGAGLASGFSDEAYINAGAVVVNSAAEAWSADMVVKVKEPLPAEYGYFRPGLILYTYLHLAAESSLTKALLDNQVTAIAYETIQGSDRALPLLQPMSEVAGRMSVQIGAQYLESFYGGSGVLLGGVPGVLPAEVVIVGGGIVGTNAAKMAVGAGARVTLLDISADRLRYLDDVFGGRLQTVMSNPSNIADAVEKADLLIGAVLIPGARAPQLVSEDMVRSMRAGSVIVDVAIDQGGSIETVDRVTTHDQPTYTKHGVLHYSVANMPGAVPRTSTIALNNATLPFGLSIANAGFQAAAKSNPMIAKGINTLRGSLTFEAVAEAHSLPYTPLADALAA
jgi:alanine dehydrogenase